MIKKIYSTMVIAAALFFAAVSFSSCGKYEEGPSISLRTKKARLVGSWEIDKVLYNKIDLTKDFIDEFGVFEWIIKKDGAYELFAGGDREHGKWEFNADKDKLIITVNNETDTYTILKLSNSELWLEMPDDSDKIEFQFKAK